MRLSTSLATKGSPLWRTSGSVRLGNGGILHVKSISARDIQTGEYQPLGSFQAKATATAISPWIVTRAALEPFRVPTPERERPLLLYLREPGPLGYDIALEVGLPPEGGSETVICRSNTR